MTAVASPAPSVPAGEHAAPVAQRVLLAAPDLIASAFAGFGLAAMVLVLAGRFSPGWVFPIGLLGAALAVAVCGIGREPVDRRAVVWTLIAIGVVLVWVVVNSFYSAENLFAHRDPATYNLAGRWLMDHSSLHIPIQADVFGSPRGSGGAGAGFSSSSPTELYAQGNHLLPAMLAVSGWLFGTGAIFKANVVFGGVALLALFGLARRVMDVRIALVGMIVFAVSMPMIFVSRDTYSEPLALLFLVGGLGLLHRAVESGRVREYALAGFVVGMAAPVRVDSAVSLLAVLITAGALPIFAARAARRAAVIRSLAVVGCLAVPTLVGWLDVTRLSYGYYRDERHHIMPIFYAGYVLLVILPLLVLLSWQPRVRRLIEARETPRRATVTAGVVICGGFVFLASRPLWTVAHGRYSAAVVDLQTQAGDKVDATRTYSEQTVRWLAQYLGWPVVVLGVAGYVLLIRRCLRTRSTAALGTITVGLAVSLLYLWTAQITPDQPWAMRRYVPAVMPIMVVAAAYTLCVLFRQGAVLIRAGAVALATAAIVLPLVATAPMASAREEVPQYTQVSRVCAQVGKHGAVLSVDAPALTSYAQTIRSYCGVPSLGMENATPATLAQVRGAVNDHGRTLFLLSTDVSKIQYADGAAPSAPFSVVRTTRWPSVLHGPPTDVVHEQVAVYLATVRDDGLAVPVG